MYISTNHRDEMKIHAVNFDEEINIHFEHPTMYIALTLEEWSQLVKTVNNARKKARSWS